MSRRIAGLLVLLCVAAVGAAPAADARSNQGHRLTRQAKKLERKRLMRAVKHNPRLIRSKSFIKRAALVDFKLPITVRLRGSTASTNPNLAKIDLGASLGQRSIGLGGSLSGEITFHDSFDGGALGNVDITL